MCLSPASGVSKNAHTSVMSFIANLRFKDESAKGSHRKTISASLLAIALLFFAQYTAQAAIQFRAASKDVQNNAAALTALKPTGTSVGDLLIAWASNDLVGTWTPPAGQVPIRIGPTRLPKWKETDGLEACPYWRRLFFVNGLCRRKASKDTVPWLPVG